MGERRFRVARASREANGGADRRKKAEHAATALSLCGEPEPKDVTLNRSPFSRYNLANSKGPPPKAKSCLHRSATARDLASGRRTEEQDFMKVTGTFFAIVGLLWIVNAIVAKAEDRRLSSHIQVTKYAPGHDSFPGCTHIGFDGETEIVTAGDRLFYRTDSQSPFRESALKGLKDAHSVVFNPHERLFYATDTGNHRLVTFRDPASPQVQNRLTSLADTRLQRPHDIVFDQSTGWMYSLNPESSRVFRFKAAGGKADSLALSKHLGYSRALTVVSGRLYVIGSSAGAVVEVVDFGKQQYKIHNSFEKKKDAPAGSWKSTGLVLNDVDFFNGHWYATSYFCPTYAGSHNCDENKFIRFRSWRDLKEGTWDDLSQFLPSMVVPYYLTPREESLFIAVFNHEHPGTFDKVYRLTIADQAGHRSNSE